MRFILTEENRSEANKSWWPFTPRRSYLARMLSVPRIDDYYVFADLERLSKIVTEEVTILWRVLDEHLPLGHILNHPTRSMRRYELLRTLYERGVNQFNVYRLTEGRWPTQYPVFIRGEMDHAAARFPLLNSCSELEEAIIKINKEAKNRANILVVEFCDTSDSS